jgi:hypothetical protein
MGSFSRHTSKPFRDAARQEYFAVAFYFESFGLSYHELLHNDPLQL